MRKLMHPGTLIPLVVALLVCLPSPGHAAKEPSPAVFRAGAATSNITPELGGKIVGNFVTPPATDIHDELHARCLVLDDGKTMMALVVCDIIGLHRSVSLEARRLIEEATGIPPSHVAISGTHTHSATSVLGPNRYASESPLDDYQRFVARRIADGVRRAVNALRPAEIAFGTADVPEHVFNRRWVMRDGTAAPNPFGKVEKVKMNPPTGSADLIEPAGPIDPTVSFIAIREPGGAMISLYAAYSLHYVGGVGAGEISADYFGVFCEEMARLHPGTGERPFVAMLANGTSGDINNVNFREPRKPSKPYERMREVARDVANKVNSAMGKVEWKNRAELDARYRELPLSWRQIEPELLSWAKEKQAAPKTATSSKADLPLIYSNRVQQLSEAKSPALIPLQILRIGDVCIGTFPCETFAEIGLEFRKRSPFAKSFMVELNHGYFGYLPTPRHFEMGGYETWPGTNSLERQASVKMLDTLLEMAAETAPKTN